MGPPAQDLGAGGRREGRPIGGQAPQRQGTRGPGRGPPPQGPEVLGGDHGLRRHRACACHSDYRPQRAHRRARRRVHRQRQTPNHPPRPRPGTRCPCETGPFFPQPRPRFGSWHRARPRGGRATGANAPGGRAHRLRPRCGPPARAPGGDPAGPAGPEQRGQRASPGATSSRKAVHRSHAEPAATPHRDSPPPAGSDATAGPERPRDHNAGTGAGGRGDCRGRSRAVAGLRVR
jgi:hypothetical protein